MNVLIITDYKAVYEGNFICSIKRLCEKINNGSVSFSFPTEAKAIDWVERFAKEYEVVFREDNPTKQLGQLIGLIKQKKIDIIYTHFCLLKTQTIVKTASVICRKKLVQHWHNHYQEVPGLKGMLFRWAFEGDLNIGCSKSVAESLPYKNEKVSFVNNAIEYSRLEQYDKTFSFDMNKEYEMVILMFGFDFYRKGVDVAIRALQLIANQYRIKLVISLAKNEDKVIEEIRKISKDDLGWIEIVKARNDVATFYHAADIFLSAAREEGLCYSVLEAVYCGCTLISSEIDGVPYQTIPYCYTFESENYKQLAERIIDSVHITVEQKEINKRAVCEKYDLDKWADEIYKKLSNISEM